MSKDNSMFKRIFVPLDGTQQAMHAAAIGIAMAKSDGAGLMAFEVIAPLPAVTLAADRLLGNDSDHAASASRRARQHLADVAILARDTAIPFEDGYAFDRRPYAAIASAAKQAQCGLIVVGASEYAHGRDVKLSNEVARLLSSTDIPVLVCR